MVICSASFLHTNRYLQNQILLQPENIILLDQTSRAQVKPKACGGAVCSEQAFGELRDQDLSTTIQNLKRWVRLCCRQAADILLTHFQKSAVCSELNAALSN